MSQCADFDLQLVGAHCTGSTGVGRQLIGSTGALGGN
jgi:hypothetical protein